MALDEKRRQQKLAKKLANRKAKQAARKPLVSLGSQYTPAQAARFPVADCLVPTDLFQDGIGNVVLTRQLPNGELAVAVFLLDIYCLGVKDAFYRVVSTQEYTYYRQQLEGSSLEQVHPSCLRKLVKGAVQYARDIGLAPHADYAGAAQLFGNIEAAACPVRYTYGGRDGKPLYISGPNESPARSRKIVDTLKRKLGSEGFHFVAGIETGDGDAAVPVTGGSPVTLINYEITVEPVTDTTYAQLPESVMRQLEKFYHTLQKKPKEVIATLLPLIAQYPDVPMLYNYLYNAYVVLNDYTNAERILEETRQRFPDYLFGRIAYANGCLHRGEIEKVPEIFDGKYDLKLLYPERNRFHISEAINFYTVMAQYFHARGERSRAETYYNLLRQISPEHPHTKLVKSLLYPSRLGRWLRDLTSPH
jgi:DNA-binding transcriptional regulator YbjK